MPIKFFIPAILVAALFGGVIVFALLNTNLPINPLEKDKYANMFTDITAGDLYAHCRLAADTGKKDLKTYSTALDACLYYIGGLEDGYVYGANKAKIIFCLPQGLKTIDTANLFVERMKYQPKLRQKFPASLELLFTLEKQYPCPREAN